MKNKSLFMSLFLTITLAGFISCALIAQETEECQSDFKIENLDAIKALVIKADIPTSQVGPKMGEIFEKVFGYIGQNQITPAGPPFAVYLSFDPQGNTVFETGVPVSDEVSGSGEIEYREYPATKVVEMVYTGSYENMGPAYQKIMDYMKENNLKAKGISWEIYLTDPSAEPDPNKYQTIIMFPIE